MRNYNRSQWVDSLEGTDLPVPREGELSSNHETSAENAEYEGELESFEKSWHFFKKGDVFCFFGCCTPGHVDLKEMRQECL